MYYCDTCDKESSDETCRDCGELCSEICQNCGNNIENCPCEAKP